MTSKKTTPDSGADKIEILYNSGRTLVCVKPPGTLSEEAGEDSMPRLLEKQIAKMGVFDRVMGVHRLDKSVGGLMVFALGPTAASALSDCFRNGRVTKEYLAVVHGLPEERAGRLDDLLYHDQKKNKTYVVGRTRRGVREAALEYRLFSSVADLSGSEDAAPLSLLGISLLTGRTHQIRAQFSSRKMPLWGDGRYGSPVRGGRVNIALWSTRLAFSDPISGEEINIIKAPPAEYPWRAFGEPEELERFISASHT